MSTPLIVSLIVIAAFFLWKQWKDSRRLAYWRGRVDGWVARENSILGRAEKHPDYDREKIWKDLIQ